MSNFLRVLVVDDERSIRRFLRASLSDQYTVFEAINSMEALHAVAVDRPDLVLLDIGLPDLNGIETTKRLREWTLVPIIIISVRDQEEDKIAALDAGADDYLTKPFNTGELLARMRAALRHCAQPEIESIYQSGDLSINLTKREVRVNKELVSLTPTEYDILRALLRHSGKVLTHQQLIQSVWGENHEAGSHLLRVNISNLRKKIEKDQLRPNHIITEPGVGYRLKDIEEI